MVSVIASSTKDCMLARRVPLVEKELFTLTEHMISPLVFSGVRVVRSLVLYVCFVYRCLHLLSFFFWPLCCLFFSTNTNFIVFGLTWSRLEEEFEDTKGVIRIPKSKKNRQHNGQKKKDKRCKQRYTKHTYKTKDRTTRTPLKTRGEIMCSVRVNSSFSTSGTRLANIQSFVLEAITLTITPLMSI
jgi:hypothetical protein